MYIEILEATILVGALTAEAWVGLEGEGDCFSDVAENGAKRPQCNPVKRPPVPSS